MPSREQALETALRERGYHAPGECTHVGQSSYFGYGPDGTRCMMEVAALALPAGAASPPGLCAVLDDAITSMEHFAEIADDFATGAVGSPAHWAGADARA